jgi:hypothetical protein
MKTIKISKDLDLPLEIVTQTIGILAKRRAGKSYTMRRIVEQLFQAGQQVVLVDPKGDQWGVRSTADGKAPGLPIVILGGEHGDVPLEVNAGEIVAKLVVEERVSILIDLSFFRKHEVATFMTGFLENLYRLKAKEIYRTPVMVVIDEADAVAPQKPQKGEERMLGAAEDIVRRGGQRGIGCTLVTQRSAVLNKNVLTQTQVLVALRTIAPQDLAAMDAWIQVHGEPEQRKILMESLPSLPVGDAWFWSPGWPTVEGIFKRVHVLPIETFDSGATPEVGKKPIEPKNLADIDIDILKRQMAATIEKVKQDDPRMLRKRIVQLEKEIKMGAPKSVYAAPTTKIKRIEVPVVGKRTLEKLKVAESNMRRMLKAMKEYVPVVEASVNKFSADLGKVINQKPSVAPTIITAPRNELQETNVPISEFKPSMSKQKILNSLSWLETIGVAEGDKTQVALLSDQSPTSGGYFNNLGTLRTAGFIEYPRAGMLVLTGKGRAVADPGNVPSTSEELQQQIIRKLSASQAAILKVAISLYPESITKGELAANAGEVLGRTISSTSGGYFNNLGYLRSLKLIDYPAPGRVAAQKLLFLE